MSFLEKFLPKKSSEPEALAPAVEDGAGETNIETEPAEQGMPKEGEIWKSQEEAGILKRRSKHFVRIRTISEGEKPSIVATYHTPPKDAKTGDFPTDPREGEELITSLENFLAEYTFSEAARKASPQVQKADQGPENLKEKTEPILLAVPSDKPPGEAQTAKVSQATEGIPASEKSSEEKEIKWQVSSEAIRELITETIQEDKKEWLEDIAKSASPLFHKIILEQYSDKTPDVLTDADKETLRLLVDQVNQELEAKVAARKEELAQPTENPKAEKEVIFPLPASQAASTPEKSEKILPDVSEKDERFLGAGDSSKFLGKWETSHVAIESLIHHIEEHSKAIEEFLSQDPTNQSDPARAQTLMVEAETLVTEANAIIEVQAKDPLKKYTEALADLQQKMLTLLSLLSRLSMQAETQVEKIVQEREKKIELPIIMEGASTRVLKETGEKLESAREKWMASIAEGEILSAPEIVLEQYLEGADLLTAAHRERLEKQVQALKQELTNKIEEKKAERERQQEENGEKILARLMQEDLPRVAKDFQGQTVVKITFNYFPKEDILALNQQQANTLKDAIKEVNAKLKAGPGSEATEALEKLFASQEEGKNQLDYLRTSLQKSWKALERELRTQSLKKAERADIWKENARGYLEEIFSDSLAWNEGEKNTVCELLLQEMEEAKKLLSKEVTGEYREYEE